MAISNSYVSHNQRVLPLNQKPRRVSKSLARPSVCLRACAQAAAQAATRREKGVWDSPNAMPSPSPIEDSQKWDPWDPAQSK